MTSNAKRINPSLRSRIETVKSRVRTTTRMFDGDGHAFRTALQELLQEGYVIEYHRKSAVYTVEARPEDHAALTARQNACLRRARDLAQSQEARAIQSTTNPKGDHP